MKIGNFDVKVVKKLEEKRKVYPMCDKNGNEVKSDYIPQKRVYKNSDGVIVTDIYRKINGKAIPKLSKTKVVKTFDEIDLCDIADLRVEEYYFCECDSLKQYLKEKGKALRFIYTNGNGFKAYDSYLAVYKDNLLLLCGFGSLTELIDEVKAGRTEQKEKVKENPEEILLAVSSRTKKKQ